MLTHARAAVAPRRAPPSFPLEPPEPWAALLDALGSIENERNIIVLGKDGLDLMCALLRAGAPQVTHLRSHERLEADRASMVIIPQMPSLDWLEGALAAICHALAANGRLMVCADPLPLTQTRIRRILTRRGFSGIRVNRAAGRLVISAEASAFGLRRCA